MKILIALNTTWNLVNFRSGLIRAFIETGHEVIGVAPSDAFVSNFEKLGCKHVSVSMDNTGTNPIKDFRLFFDYLVLFRCEMPNIVLTYTVKPNVYATLAAHVLGIPVINNISGLGTVFIRHSLLTNLVKGLYTLALSRSSKVFFQNDEDEQQFITDNIVSKKQTEILPGSGIDLDKYNYSPVSCAHNKPFRFLLVARMLWDKGIGEFVAASRSVKKLYPDIECCLLGFLDVENPTAISRTDIDEWVSEGVVSYLGVSDNVENEIMKSSCVVLPSYREGTPRSLLEAAAVGRPIITTNTTGCRNVVDDRQNGFLCKVKDSADLAHVMIQMIEIGEDARKKMAEYGRKKVEREYDEKIVIHKYMNAVKKAVKI